VTEATQTDEAFWPGGHDALVDAAREAQGEASDAGQRRPGPR
jgi:hypothetical protein